ncbi:hypothetical protein [Streptomyces sp. NPDC059468]|uniref:hypothetical protein n=1 Tax=Streptomyces sp. NPDC059468 TaxID=3346845 RepID=UPI003678DFAE
MASTVSRDWGARFPSLLVPRGVASKLHTAVCSGKVTLAAAQQAIVSDWTTALTRLGLS